MKSCELCKSMARMYCDSDRASLCWDCDAKVHSANFLVARHSRSLLCHVCQSPTAWSASGAKLTPTVSVCERCSDGCERTMSGNASQGYEESQGGSVGDDESDDDGGENVDNDGNDSVDDNEDGDNQVVPLSSTPPPPAPSPSSSEESSSRFCNGDREDYSNRMLENDADLRSDDDHGCSSPRRKSRAEVVLPEEAVEVAFVDSMRPLKRRRRRRSTDFFNKR